MDVAVSSNKRENQKVKQFAPRLDVLPPPQRQLWNELGSVPDDFVLYGGTALALRLGHRRSEDFDFFAGTAFDPATLQRSIAFLRDLPQSDFSQYKQNTLTALVERDGSVRVSFFGGLGLNRLQDPEIAGNIRVKVASLLDLAGTKAGTVYGRFATKDYLDLYALLQAGISLENILGAGRAVYGAQFRPELTVRALTYFEDLQGPALSDQQKAVLLAAAQRVQLTQIPTMTGALGLVPPGRSL